MGKFNSKLTIIVMGLGLFSSCLWADHHEGQSSRPSKGNYASRLGITSEHYREHNLLHPQRLELLAMAGYSFLKKMGLWPSTLGFEVTMRKISKHDWVKNQDAADAYRAVGYSHEKDIPERLEEEFGKRHSDAETASRKKLPVFTDMDALDHWLDDQFYIQENMLDEAGNRNSAAQFLSMFEHTLDSSDRGKNPFTEIEMNRRVVPTTVYEKDLDWVSKLLATYLQKYYPRIVGDKLLPKSLSPTQCEKLMRFKAYGEYVLSHRH